MRIVTFGAYDPDYARNHVLRQGLLRLGVRVDACRAPVRARLLRRSVLLLLRWLRTPRPDAILVPEFRHKDVPLARFLADCAGVPLIVDPLVSRYDTKIEDWRNASPDSFQAAHNRRLDRAAMRFADLLICDTTAHADYYVRHTRVPKVRTAVVPVGFDDVVFRPLPPPPIGPFRVAFYGSFLPLHGVEVLVEAARRLRAHDIRFLLIGDGGTFEHVTAAVRDGIDFECVPPLPPRELVQRLEAAHVLLGVFGRTAKAARVVPNKVYQSLALERAVVTADTPAVREFFIPGEHLWAVPPGDPSALADAILRLRADAPLRQRLASQGRQWVQARYRPEAVARTFLESGRRVLGWGA